MNFGNIVVGIVLILAGLAAALGSAFLYFMASHGENNILYFIGGISAMVIGYKVVKAE